ncbi:hypothetical protein JZ751_002200 [Albula glossodonta]|uniref:Uncharacterized protein n=1 Tax=Albula glossodonta TaxID=121402 RepID=A0A8T2P7D8_9TELE|nr:hypothetical protein JZ751_002200 [Albula glossodonta]
MIKLPAFEARTYNGENGRSVELLHRDKQLSASLVLIAAFGPCPADVARGTMVETGERLLENGDTTWLSAPPNQAVKDLCPEKPQEQQETDMGTDPSPACPEAPRQAPELWEAPHIVRHKPSSITFSDYPNCCHSCEATAGCQLFITEEPDSAESPSSVEDNSDGDNDNDDVFPERLQCRGLLAGRHHRSELKRNRLRSGRDTNQGLAGSSTYEPEDDSSDREWSEGKD